MATRFIDVIQSDTSGQVAGAAERVHAAPAAGDVQQLQLTEGLGQGRVDDQVIAEWIEAQHDAQQQQRRAGGPGLRTARGRVLDGILGGRARAAGKSLGQPMVEQLGRLQDRHGDLRDAEKIPERAEVAQSIASAHDRTKAIVDAANDPDSPSELCQATVELFASILASEAGNLVLKVFATGGVYIAGGVAALHALSALQKPRFMEIFTRKGRFNHNHAVRLAKLEVEEHEHIKEAATSAYFPLVRNEANWAHVTDTQLIEIPAGGFGAIGTNLLPPQPLIINQGGLTFASEAIGVVQPLTQLLKIRAANDVVRAEVDGSRGKARKTGNDIALKVHKLYYAIVVAEAERSAILAKVEASEALQRERVQLVKYGSALETDLIESRAQSLQAKQELLSNQLQLSDLHMQFNDVIGLPLETELTLDPPVTAVPDSCTREDCIKLAVESHPEIVEARAMVAKAESAVRLARYNYVPDVEAFARYSFQHNVPFLAGNFGTVGMRLTYDLFDGGRRRAILAAGRAQLAQAKENLTRVTDEVELGVSTAYNKLERTRQMVTVAQELVALRAESRRVVAEQSTRGAALRSLALASLAQELDANAHLLQSRLDHVQAVAELDQATGRTPN